MRVDVSGQKFAFPAKCACCNGQPDAELTISASKSTGKRVVHTTSKAWSVPYCSRCVQHVQAAEMAARVAWVFGILSAVGGAVFFWNDSQLPFAALFTVVGLVGTGLIHNRMMSRARSLCVPNCACVSRSISYLGWYGTLHRFEITSVEFALHFMAANHSKLVNLTPDARRLLQSNSVAVPSALQSPERYMH
jgi:hypothetical protein